MLQPVGVKPLPRYHIWLRYADGVAGEIDLSDLAGKGVFRAWDEPGYFSKVYITSHRAIAWDDDIELCAGSVICDLLNALYMELTGKTVEEVMPGVKQLTQVHDA